MSSALEVEDLHYRYPDGTVALRGISFIVEEGRCVGLIGPNGAGKSTLLQHLNGLLPEPVTSGGLAAVRIFGAAIGPDNLHEIRRQVGVLFQDANDQLFCPTVFEDIAFGPRQQMLSENQVAERVEAAHSPRRARRLGNPAAPPSLRRRKTPRMPRRRAGVRAENPCAR